MDEVLAGEEDPFDKWFRSQKWAHRDKVYSTLRYVYNKLLERGFTPAGAINTIEMIVYAIAGEYSEN